MPGSLWFANNGNFPSCYERGVSAGNWFTRRFWKWLMLKIPLWGGAMATPSRFFGYQGLRNQKNRTGAATVGADLCARAAKGDICPCQTIFLFFWADTRVGPYITCKPISWLDQFIRLHYSKIGLPKRVRPESVLSPSEVYSNRFQPDCIIQRKRPGILNPFCAIKKGN